MNPVSITLPGIIVAVIFAVSITSTLVWMLRLPAAGEAQQRAAKAIRGALSAATFLVPVHGGALSERVVALACQMAKRRGAGLNVLYVKEIPRLLPVDADIPEQQEAAERAIAQARSIAERFDQKVSFKVVKSRDAGNAIVREAYETGADVILMGAGGMPRQGSFSLGDAAAFVLRNAPCEVILDRSATPR
ncbi:MAG: universal stress protein [Chloroflexota bacterium]